MTVWQYTFIRFCIHLEFYMKCLCLQRLQKFLGIQKLYSRRSCRVYFLLFTCITNFVNLMFMKEEEWHLRLGKMPWGRPACLPHWRKRIGAGTVYGVAPLPPLYYTWPSVPTARSSPLPAATTASSRSGLRINTVS